MKRGADCELVREFAKKMRALQPLQLLHPAFVLRQPTIQVCVLYRRVATVPGLEARPT